MNLRFNILRWGAYALTFGPLIGALAALAGLVNASWRNQPATHVSSLIGGAISIMGIWSLTRLPDWQGTAKMFTFIGAIGVIIGDLALVSYPLTQLTNSNRTPDDVLYVIFSLGGAALLVGNLSLAFSTWISSGLFYGSMPWLLSAMAISSAIVALSVRSPAGQDLSTTLAYGGLLALGVGFLIYVCDLVDIPRTRGRQPSSSR